MKITDYLIVRNEDYYELEKLVKENIRAWGWQPLGGVSSYVHVYGGSASTNS